LPANVHLLTLEEWEEEGLLLIRLEHFYESTDDAAGDLSKPVKVALGKLFEPFGFLLDALETTLNANQVLEEAKRLQWRKGSPEEPGKYCDNNPAENFVPLESNDFSVLLEPMQIRTFVLVFKNRFA